MVLNIKKWLLISGFVLANFLSYAQDSTALIKTVWFKNTLPKLVFDEKDADAKQIVDGINSMLKKDAITEKELQSIYLKYDSLIAISSKKMSDSVRIGKIDLTSIVVTHLLDSLKHKQAIAKEKYSPIDTSFWSNISWGWIVSTLLSITSGLLFYFVWDKSNQLRKTRSDLKNQLAINKSFEVNRENEQRQMLEANKKKKQEENAKDQQRKEEEEQYRKEQGQIQEEEQEALLEQQRQQSELNKQEQNRVVFYLPIPSVDRVFSDNNRFTKYQSGRTVYCFFVNNITDTEAEFELCEEASIFAIDKPQSHIETACDPTNERDNSAKRIETTVKGKAQLVGDIWCVSEKAKIKYHYI